MTTCIHEILEFGGHSNAFYGRPEEDDRCYFDTRTAAQLLRCEAILQALMEEGVHTWEGYESAMKRFNEEWKK